MSIDLKNITSNFSTDVINDNFRKVEEYINDNLLNRDGTETGEANQMELPLDMNSNPVLNASVDPDNPRSMLTREFADSLYVKLLGDTMQGSLNMADYPLFVREAINGNEPARKDQLDTERSQRISGDASLNQALAVERNTRISEDNRLTQERIQGDLDVTRGYQAADAALARSIEAIPIIREGDLTRVGDAQVSTNTGTQALTQALDQRVSYVDTIADLLAMDTSALVDGQQVQVKEYHAGIGVGGGEFYWDTSDGSDDDGGVTIAVPGIAIGRFKRIINTQLTPFDFGCKESPFDSSIELQKAFTFCSESGIPLDGLGRNFLISDANGAVPAWAGSFRPDFGLYAHKGLYLRNIRIWLEPVYQPFLSVINLYTPTGYTARLENVYLNGNGSSMDTLDHPIRESGGRHGLRFYGNVTDTSDYKSGRIELVNVKIENVYSDGIVLRDIEYDGIQLDGIIIQTFGRNGITSNSRTLLVGSNLEFYDHERTGSGPGSGFHYEPDSASTTEGFILNNVIARRCATGIRSDSPAGCQVGTIRVHGYHGRENDLDLGFVNRAGIYDSIYCDGLDLNLINTTMYSQDGVGARFGNVSYKAVKLTGGVRVRRVTSDDLGIIENYHLDIEKAVDVGYQAITVRDFVKLANIAIGDMTYTSSRPLFATGKAGNVIHVSIKKARKKDPTQANPELRIDGYDRAYITNSDVVRIYLSTTKYAVLHNVFFSEKVPAGRVLTGSAVGGVYKLENCIFRMVTPEGLEAGGVAPVDFDGTARVISVDNFTQGLDGTLTPADYTQTP